MAGCDRPVGVELSGEIYRLLFEVNPRPTYVFDRETRQILLVNDAAVQMYGWSREEFLAMTLDDLRPPADRRSFLTAYALAKDGPSYSRAARHWKKNGEVIEARIEVVMLTLAGRGVSMSSVVDVTGIAEAERRFRLLVENSAEAVAITSESGVIEYVSPAHERILGYPASEVIGGTSLRRVHPDDAQTWRSPAPAETSTFVARVMHRDGTWRWIEVTTTNLTHDPAVRAYVSNYRDITERKLAEQAQRETQRRLEYLLSATAAMTYTSRVNGDTDATFISANVEEQLGYKPEQFTTARGFWAEHLHPDDLPRVKAELERQFPSGEMVVDYRFRHADGSYRWIHDASRVKRDEHGTPVELVGYSIDITQQKQAEESMRRSEWNFRQLIERSPTAMLVQRDGVYVYVNPAFAMLLGHDSPADLIGTQVLDDVHPDDRDRIRERMQRALAPAGTPPAEVRVLRRDGRVLVLEMEGMLVDFDGKPSTLAIGRDITERREMFERMALADRMLTVGTLAAGVAHEINNPLAYTASNLEVMASELACLLANVPTRLPRHELPALIADAREGVARVSAIVRDLRALARPEDDTRGPLDVVALLASSIKMAHHEIRHRARVVESHAANLPAVLANPSRLGQVFLNLLINAAQAIPEGRTDHNEIRVRTRPALDGKRVVVEIEDTGIGIPASLQRRIFDPFFTTKAPGVGMGLGLAISHQIVRSMDGEIGVESQPGVGTIFRVTLPIAAERTADAVAEAARPESLCARILLVDDEAALGRALCALLGDHEVVPVTCARDAIAKLSGGEWFDVILCDLMMPEVSGIDLYRQIAPAHQARVVFMTGGAFTPQAREFLAKVDRPRLDKPFSEHELREAIERVRSSRDTRPDPTPAPA